MQRSCHFCIIMACVCACACACVRVCVCVCVCVYVCVCVQDPHEAVRAFNREALAHALLASRDEPHPHVCPMLDALVTPTRQCFAVFPLLRGKPSACLHSQSNCGMHLYPPPPLSAGLPLGAFVCRQPGGRLTETDARVIFGGMLAGALMFRVIYTRGCQAPWPLCRVVAPAPQRLCAS
jgi:hypothetical protein